MIFVLVLYHMLLLIGFSFVLNRIIIVVKANVVGKFDGDHSTKKRKREEEEEVAVGSIDVEFVQMIGEKLGEKMVMVDAVDLGDTKGDVLAVLRASAADAFGCSPNDVGEMRSRLDGEDALTLLNDAGLVKRLRSMAQVRVVLRDARDAEIDKLRAEMLLLEQNNKSAAGSGVPAAAEPPSPPAPASAPAPAPAPAVPSVSSKSLQRLAVESLFTPVSHQNTAEIMTLCDELGLDSSNVESTEAILLYMDTSHLQRLAARLKVGPQGLFKKAFLATSLVPLGVEEEQLQQPPSPPRNSANRGEVDAIERNRIRIRNIMKTHRRSQSASS